jgi:succinyl-diaminopimelate desuccinylase
MMELAVKIDEMKGDIISSTQDLVRIRSVQSAEAPGAPFGEEVGRALDYALSLSEKLGFRTVNLDGCVGYAEYGQGEEYVAVLGHLDVVPPGDGWTYPPFGGEIHGGRIYGRGTVDDKSPMVSSLFALKALRDLGLPMKRKVRVIFGTNEETGCADMPRYNATEPPPFAGFTPDGHFPLVHAEKGLTVFDVAKHLAPQDRASTWIEYIAGGSYANIVPDYAEARLHSQNTEEIMERCEAFSREEGSDVSWIIEGRSITIRSRGLSAHGSTPHLGKNSVMQLFGFLGTLGLPDSDLKSVVDFFNSYVGFETDGCSLGISQSDDVSGDLTFNVGAVKTDENGLVMKLNIRYPVKGYYDDFIVPLEEKLGLVGLRIENMWHKKPLYFPEDHPLVKALLQVYTEQTGLPAGLISSGMGTYAKEIPNTVAFGPILPGRLDLDHKADENILIEDLILNTRIYASAIYRLANL